jgi:hypothetical protein
MNFSAPPRRAAFVPNPRSGTSAGWSKPAAFQKSPPAKPLAEDYPVLGASAGAGSGKNVAVAAIKPTNSYAKLAASWAKSEEETKLAEANEMRAHMERQRREEYELAERRRIFNSIHAHRKQTGLLERTDEDEYINEEFDNGDSYIQPERLSTAHYTHYEEHEYEDGNEEYGDLN